MNASMEDRDGAIWMDGELVDWREARLHVLAHTLHHGMGVFEGVRAYAADRGTAIFRLDDHVRRFFESAHTLQMALPFTPEQIAAAHAEVVRANGLTQCYLRPIAFYGGERVGVSARGNRVHVAIAAWPWDAYLGAQAHERGIRVKISSFSRIHHGSLLTKAKACGHYINSMLAHQEAVQSGYGEALMLDPSGYVAEASTSNLFMLRHGEFVTPPRTAILEGITRDTVIRLSEVAGVPVIERNITRDELYTADECFLTGTAAELTPVVEVDNRRIGRGEPGALTRRMQAAYVEVTRGRMSEFQDWLTFV